jgi:hypothetical protein
MVKGYSRLPQCIRPQEELSSSPVMGCRQARRFSRVVRQTAVTVFGTAAPRKLAAPNG